MRQSCCQSHTEKINKWKTLSPWDRARNTLILNPFLSPSFRHLLSRNWRYVWIQHQVDYSVFLEVDNQTHVQQLFSFIYEWIGWLLAMLLTFWICMLSFKYSFTHLFKTLKRLWAYFFSQKWHNNPSNTVPQQTVPSGFFTGEKKPACFNLYYRLKLICKFVTRDFFHIFCEKKSWKQKRDFYHSGEATINWIICHSELTVFPVSAPKIASKLIELLEPLCRVLCRWTTIICWAFK